MDLSHSLGLLTLHDPDVVVKSDPEIRGPWAKVQSKKSTYSVGDFIKLEQIGGGVYIFRAKTVERRQSDSVDVVTISASSFSFFNFPPSSKFVLSVVPSVALACPPTVHIVCQRSDFDPRDMAARIKDHCLYLQSSRISDHMSIQGPDNSADLVMIGDDCKISFTHDPRTHKGHDKISYPQGPLWIINASLLGSSKIFARMSDQDRVALLTSCTNIFELTQRITDALKQGRAVVVFDDVGAHKEDCMVRIIHKYSFTIQDALGLNEVAPAKDSALKSGSWDKIGGYSEIVKAVRKHVDTLEFFENSLSRKIGISTPKGILLYGPPGCSKSMIARAIAGSANVEFISLKGPEIFSKWVGDSEKAISEIFRKARKRAPCVVFFDEFDSVGASRSLDVSSGVESRVVSQLLSEIDGLSGLSKVLVVAATNRPDVLDPALLRPGRLDLHFYVPLPDAASREAIIRLQLAGTCLADIDGLVDKLVPLSADCSGAEVVSGCKSLLVAQIKGQDASSNIQRSLFKQ